jgi:hypothetical protein
MIGYLNKWELRSKLPCFEIISADSPLPLKRTIITPPFLPVDCVQ